MVEAATIVADEEQWLTLQGPVELDIVFYLERPKSIRIQDRPEPIVPPDIDKLVRGVADALTIAEIYEDDSQVVKLTAIKSYADLRDPGAFIVVRHAQITSQLWVDPSVTSS